MAVELSREGWIALYSELRNATQFLTRQFTLKPGGAYNGDKVAIDIERFDEDVAIVVKKCTGPNINDFDEFTTKEFKPPTYGEAFEIDVCELLNRMAGVDPFTAAGQSYASQLVAKMVKGFMLVDNKIQRAVELQASQILQTGTLSLTNSDGDVVYELDFQPKASHFPTTSNAWGGGSEDIIGDLESLAEVIRADGKVDPDMLILGSLALKHFYDDTKIQARLDNRRIDIGELAPEMVGSGATFHGVVWIGEYAFQIWSYKSTFKDPQTGVATKYIATDKVVMKSTMTRLDMTFARVPLPLGPDPRVEGLLPGRMTSTNNNFDVTPNVYSTPNGKQIMGELESRPLLIPVQIDGFGCLDTQP